ncbi:MAG TPA: hypothetical protein VHP11_07585 [Tepidisphaeraceae bacterium]|nr:hypothetical protein [Tepidisphaeraceae bacterium]
MWRKIQLTKMAWPGNWLAAVLFIGTLQGWPAISQESQNSSPTVLPPGTPTTRHEESIGARAASQPSGASESAAEETAKLSPAAAQVLKMIQAGVSKEVISTYIDQAPISRPLTATDVIELKNKGVPDELIAGLLNRAREISALVAQARSDAANTPNPPDANPVMPGPNTGLNNGVMDPESYEFWWYHYAYPRALAEANKRIFSSYQPFFEYPSDFYGYYPPLPFSPQPPAVLPGDGPTMRRH